MHKFFKPLDSFVSNGINVDLGIVNNLFDVLKGSMIDDNWSLGTFGGSNSSLDHFHV